MSTHPEFQEKMDVLDMIISILREHEENLSKVADRLDALCNSLSTVEEKVSMLDQSLGHVNRLGASNVIEASGVKGLLATVECKNWPIFRSVSQGALLVAFEVMDDLLIMSSVSDLFVFSYSEKLPDLEMSNSGKVERSFRSHSTDSDLEVAFSEDGVPLYEAILKPEAVKRWLASELGVPEEKIVEGRVLR